MRPPTPTRVGVKTMGAGERQRKAKSHDAAARVNRLQRASASSVRRLHPCITSCSSTVARRSNDMDEVGRSAGTEDRRQSEWVRSVTGVACRCAVESGTGHTSDTGERSNKKTKQSVN